MIFLADYTLAIQYFSRVWDNELLLEIVSSTNKFAVLSKEEKTIQNNNKYFL